MPWPSEDDAKDPAFEPLIEAGQGESEGFELAERDLIRHATHGDDEQTSKVLDDADPRVEEQSDAQYGEADSEGHPDA